MRIKSIMVITALTLGLTSPSASADPALALAKPTGDRPVGTTALYLKDTSRADPWVPSVPYRELMVSLFYPATSANGPKKQFMSEAEAKAVFDEAGIKGIPPSVMTTVRTDAVVDAKPAGRGLPAVVLSPGFKRPRAELTSLSEDLASHGYLVVLVDHTYENVATTFPDGRVTGCAACGDHDLEFWQKLQVPKGQTFAWDEKSTYVKNPPYFADMTMQPPGIRAITGARALAMLGDSITTDHISPAGNIPVKSPAGEWLIAHGVQRKDFNSYGARRGNHEVMMRGTFANIRLRNELVPGTEGGLTTMQQGGTPVFIYDAAMDYQKKGTPLVVIAGKEYGTGSSRDWAAKGTILLGVRAVIAESFERIHRSNLVGMGVIPLEFTNGETRQSLGLTGFESFDIAGLDESLRPRATLVVRAKGANGTKEFKVLARIDTPEEMQYYRHGGILPYVLRQLVGKR